LPHDSNVTFAVLDTKLLQPLDEGEDEGRIYRRHSLTVGTM
jgi:hypothetical protein